MLRLAVIALVALNLLLIVLEASKPPAPELPGAELPAAPPPVPGAPGIVLLRELTEDGAVAPGSRCFTVGPFDAGEALAGARRALNELSVEVTQREAEILVERGYWVFLPPLASLEEARDMAQTMRDAGIGEVEVFSNGEWDNSISAGYFLNEANATARMERVRAAGFDARTRIQQATETRIWLDYEQSIGTPLAARALAGSFPDQRHSDLPCASMSPPERRTPYSAR